jgi:hypothetical protein
VGDVQVTQPSPTQLVMRFKPDAINRPAVYRWRAETTAFISACPQPHGCQDFAPDRPGTAETRIAKAGR